MLDYRGVYFPELSTLEDGRSIDSNSRYFVVKCAALGLFLLTIVFIFLLIYLL